MDISTREFSMHDDNTNQLTDATDPKPLDTFASVIAELAAYGPFLPGSIRKTTQKGRSGFGDDGDDTSGGTKGGTETVGQTSGIYGSETAARISLITLFVFLFTLKCIISPINFVTIITHEYHFKKSNSCYFAPLCFEPLWSSI